VQSSTGNACHLDATMVHDAVHDLPLAGLDVLFIENVGNLVCPASFDLGQHRNVTLLSVPEGDDKPAKYPVMFRAADLSLVTKTDLLAYITEFSLERARASLRQIGFAGETIELTSRGGAGFDAWLEWLDREVAAQRERTRRGETARPRVQPDGASLHGSHPPAR
jgi:hydrogenase nickel incorporation protein HypB